ncbi:MAG: hemerythrin domain-containing protein [Desulfobacterales bacterium]|nr:hemerythrin domain-containing protein [Desulfobacteraceae bacterium]MDH3828192.1 hemerythrin domain-containing protein [Desulfobacterales bacterium]
MQSRGPLMIEHRLIERMITLIKQKLGQIESTNQVDPLFIDTVVDFIGIYADRTHHGKEEDILFKKLENKQMSDQDRRIMDELVDEHALGRKTTKELVEANAQYRVGEKIALAVIVSKLKKLVNFYPKHIEKEDKVFFPSYMKYLSDEEDQLMLEEFYEFDREMIHEKYKSVLKELEEY